VQRQFVGGVLEDALLDQQDVGFWGDDLLDHLSDDLALFLHDAVHGLVVLDDHWVLEVGLRGGDLELDHSDFGVDDFGGAAAGSGGFAFIEDDALDEGGIIDGAS
jgi:hypothetical protein